MSKVDESPPGDGAEGHNMLTETSQHHLRDGAGEHGEISMKGATFLKKKWGV